MTDIVSKKKRSEMMSGITSKNTLPELTVRKALHKAGYRYRLHYKALPGKPDLVMPKYKLSIFVHGCFWHRHTGCKYAYQPKTRREFWEKKFQSNVARDQKNITNLTSKGWRTLIIWECFIRKVDSSELVESLQAVIHGHEVFYELPLIPVPPAKIF